MAYRAVSWGVGALFGGGILGSYVYGALRVWPNDSSVWGALRKNWLSFAQWLLSAFLTTASFLYLFTYWFALADPDHVTVAGKPLEDAVYAYLWPVLGTFLASALLWVPVVWWVLKRNASVWWVRLNLLVTALASVALAVLVFETKDGDRGASWELPVLMAAGVSLAFHHVFEDFLVWGFSWHPATNKT